MVLVPFLISFLVLHVSMLVLSHPSVKLLTIIYVRGGDIVSRCQTPHKNNIRRGTLYEVGNGRQRQTSGDSY